jgi:flagellar biosynthesis GTPase FlhF
LFERFVPARLSGAIDPPRMSRLGEDAVVLSARAIEDERNARALAEAAPEARAAAEAAATRAEQAHEAAATDLARRLVDAPADSASATDAARAAETLEQSLTKLTPEARTRVLSTIESGQRGPALIERLARGGIGRMPG